MIDYWRIAKILLPYFIGLVIGAALVGYVQQQRIKVCQANLSISQNNEALCKTANTENQATIASLQKEVKDALQGCDARLTIKDKTLQNLKRISELKPAEIKEGAHEDKGTTGSDDPILDELNRMFPAGDGHEDGVHKTADPEPTL